MSEVSNGAYARISTRSGEQSVRKINGAHAVPESQVGALSSAAYQYDIPLEGLKPGEIPDRRGDKIAQHGLTNAELNKAKTGVSLSRNPEGLTAAQFLARNSRIDNSDVKTRSQREDARRIGQLDWHPESNR